MNEITLRHPLVVPSTTEPAGKPLPEADANKSVNIQEGIAGELSKMQLVLEYLKALYR